MADMDRGAGIGRPIRSMAKRELVEAAGGGSMRVVTVNLAESPLSWLASRGRINRRQFDAGEQLRRDWTMAQLGPRVTMRWDVSPSGGARQGGGEMLDPTLAQIEAKRRFDCAAAAVGRGLNDVLWRVVCAGEGLEVAEKKMGWPVRAGKVVLGLALDRLADHYGMK